MGKKSKRPNRKPPPTQQASLATTTATGLPTNNNNTIANVQSANHPPAVFYPSDGPSDVELLQTTSQSLQAKLDRLTQLGLENNREAFVREFVPLDLSQADANAYLQDLSTAPEAEGQWRNLVAEIAAIRCGKGVARIEGDQITTAVFYFEHPLLPKCDREVAFCCKGGEWRAEG